MSLMDIDRAAYDAMPGHNWSKLKHAFKSAAHYKAALAAPREDTAAMRLGRLVHVSLLEPAALDAVVWRRRRQGKEWEAFEAAHAGQEIVSVSDADTAQGIAAAIRSGPNAHLLRGMRAELSMTWDIDGAACKGRIDALSGAMLWDLKTTTDASADSFGKAAIDYLPQLAFYASGLIACGVVVEQVAILAVEKEAPFAQALYVLDEEQLAVGRSRYMKALRRVQEAEFLDEWPGYEAVQALRIPRWAMRIEGDDNG